MYSTLVYVSIYVAVINFFSYIYAKPFNVFTLLSVAIVCTHSCMGPGRACSIWTHVPQHPLRVNGVLPTKQLPGCATVCVGAWDSSRRIQAFEKKTWFPGGCSGWWVSTAMSLFCHPGEHCNELSVTSWVLTPAKLSAMTSADEHACNVRSTRSFLADDAYTTHFVSHETVGWLIRVTWILTVLASNVGANLTQMGTRAHIWAHTKRRWTTQLL